MTVVCFQAWDVVLRFEVQSPELLSACRFCQLPNWPTLPGQVGGLQIRLWAEDEWLCYKIQDGLPVRLRRPLPFSRRLRSDCHLALAQTSRAYIFLHAGVVGLPQGGLLLLPGRSRAGKSSLTHALAQQGYLYYSDEYALVQPDGQVLAFPRDLSLRRGPSQRIFVPARQLGWHENLRPQRAQMILQTSYQEGASWAPQPMGRSELLTHLLDNSVTAATRPSQTIAHLHALMQGCGSWRGLRGDCRQIIDWLRPQVDSSTGLSAASCSPEQPS